MHNTLELRALDYAIRRMHISPCIEGAGYGVLAVAVADLMRHIGAAYDIGVNKG